jgi:hypothetical protein
MTFGGKLFTSRIDKNKVHRVLDVGTGTGIWAIDYGTYCKPDSNFLETNDTGTADEHPEAEVLYIHSAAF